MANAGAASQQALHLQVDIDQFDIVARVYLEGAPGGAVILDSEEERQAIRVAAEATPGVKAVEDNLYRIPYSAAA